MEIDAVLKPRALGVKVISKFVEPDAAIELPGVVVTLKSAALAPDMVIYGELPVKFKVAVPTFSIVNVFAEELTVSTLPKSVLSVTEGVVSPSAIELELPVILISGAGVKPVP